MIQWKNCNWKRIERKTLNLWLVPCPECEWVQWNVQNYSINRRAKLHLNPRDRRRSNKSFARGPASGLNAFRYYVYHYETVAVELSRRVKMNATSFFSFLRPCIFISETLKNNSMYFFSSKRDNRAKQFAAGCSPGLQLQYRIYNYLWHSGGIQ